MNKMIIQSLITGCLLTAGTVCASLPALPQTSDDDERIVRLEAEQKAIHLEAEVEALHVVLERIEVCMAEAEQSGDRRRYEELRRNRDEVHHALEDRMEVLEELHAEMHHDEDDHHGELEEILHGLEMGMEAAAMLGDEETVHRLMKLAEGVRGRMHHMHHDDHHDHDHHGHHEQDLHDHRDHNDQDDHVEHHSWRDELAHAMKMVEIAAHAFREVEHQEPMEVLHHTMDLLEHALHLDEEDAKALLHEHADPGLVGELAGRAAEIWAHFGHETKAGDLAEFAEHLAHVARDMRGEIDQHHDEMAMEMNHHVEQRLDHLEHRLDEMAEMLERIMDEMRSQRRQR